MADVKEEDVAPIYAACGKLQEATKNNMVAQETQSFEFILAAVSEGPKNKQLAAGFIPKFFQLYPALVERAINVQLDLCEDDLLMVRVNAIRGLAELCKNDLKQTPRIVDVLGQLLLSENKAEIAIVKRTLTQLFKLNAAASFSALFAQIKGDDETLRTSSSAFVKDQIARMKGRLDSDVKLQKLIMEEIKAVLAQGTTVGTEFEAFLAIVKQFKLYDSEQVSELIRAQAGLDKDFDASNEEYVHQFLSCLASTAAEDKARGAPFVSYFCQKVVPVLDQLSSKNQLSLLQTVAEYCVYCDAGTARVCLEPLVASIKKHIPMVDEGEETPKINFSVVECELYIFHNLAAKDPAAAQDICGLSSPTTGQPKKPLEDDTKASKADLVKRLSFLHLKFRKYNAQVQTVARNITEKLRKAGTAEEKATLAEKQKSIQLALRNGSNIQKLATSLMLGKAKFLTGNAVTPSWQTLKAVERRPDGRVKPTRKQEKPLKPLKPRKRKDVVSTATGTKVQRVLGGALALTNSGKKRGDSWRDRQRANRGSGPTVGGASGKKSQGYGKMRAWGERD